ncbi:ABC-type multidrug transport system, ATPase and permease component [Clostridium collagenovorans DSM 3089]|uniref:ABC-type multidrug transport system, ATPase and permease component n=2 Tax=Clostridium TaxID=1485 RepID=A0A1M5XER2_9CLOT|nr:ABC-type multidrug transport system, ATPase and permease component [Clostridium collagenovorans DSM 3089]
MLKYNMRNNIRGVVKNRYTEGINFMRDNNECKRMSIGFYIFASFLVVINSFLFNIAGALVLGCLTLDNYQNIKTNILIAVGLIILSSIFYCISRFIRNEYIRRFMVSLRVSVLDKILNFSYGEFNRKSKDSYISNLVNDVNNIKDNYFKNLLRLISNIGIFIGCITIITIFDYKYGFVILVITITLMMVNKKMEKKIVGIETEISEGNENLTVDISNKFKGLELIKLNGIEEKFMSKSIFSINFFEKKKVKMNMYNSVYENIVSFFMAIFYIGVLYYLLNQFINGGSLAQMSLMILLTDQSLVISQVYTLYNKHKAYKAILKKIAVDNDKEIQSTNVVLKDFSFNEGIILKNLTFKYDNKIILDNVNLSLAKGNKYLIRGKSGVGKSTLIKLLSKTYEDYTGDIYLDDINLKDIALESFNKNISFITQDTFLFEDTLKNNITLFKDYEDDEVLNAVQLAGLDTLASDIKEIYKFNIDENGKNISGGERQRVSIARSIIRKSDIVFVDECTSSLDKELGLRVENTLLGLDSTVFEISHRVYDEVLDRYDYILEFKDGQIYKYEVKDTLKEVLQ